MQSIKNTTRLENTSGLDGALVKLLSPLCPMEGAVPADVWSSMRPPLSMGVVSVFKDEKIQLLSLYEGWGIFYLHNMIIII